VPTTPAIRLSKPSGSRPGTAAEDRPSSLPALGSGDDTDTIVEPATWAALAYNGFMWWASAGEKRHSDEVDEQSHDASLLTDLAPPVSPAAASSSPSTQTRSQQQQPQQRRTSFGAAAAGSDMVSSLASLTAHSRGAADEDGADHDRDDETQARIELAAVAYFHRLTTSLLSVLADIVDSSDEDDLLGLDLGEDAADAGYTDYDGLAGSSSRAGEEEGARLLGSAAGSAGGSAGGGDRMGWVRVDSEALAEMGLDVWSQADADFVREVSARYFGRRAYVETKGVEVCGVRVC
jgi:hypothetical protein